MSAHLSRVALAAGLAFLIGLSTPLNLVAVAQRSSGDADPQQDGSLLTSSPTPKSGTNGEPLAKSDGFIIHAHDGESVCRDATPEETRDIIRRNPYLELRPINHLDIGREENGARAVVGNGSNDGGLNIILRATSRLDANPQARDAFVRAAAAWEAVITSPITVVIDVDFGPDRFGEPYPADVLGSTSGQSLSFSNNYPTLRGRLIASASTPAETSLYNSLPQTSVPTDNGNVTRVFVSSPILRAIGEIAPIANPSTETNFGPIPSIGFNSNFPFDFDPADGVTANRVDFDSVAVHEIGHVLGFTSDVGERELQPSQPVFMSLWDLFRVRPGTASAGTFASVARVLFSGGEQVQYDGADELRLSTGRPDGTGGDGNQASHWKDDVLNNNQFIGIMDPTIRRGRHETISINDRRAIEVFGYNTGAPPAAPANDNFANASVISGSSGTTTGSNLNASKETGEPQHAGQRRWAVGLVSLDCARQRQRDHRHRRQFLRHHAGHLHRRQRRRARPHRVQRRHRPRRQSIEPCDLQRDGGHDLSNRRRWL